MKYYLWLGSDEKPLSKAWPYEDETERMAEEQRPPQSTAILRTGTKQQLIEQLGLSEEDFAD